MHICYGLYINPSIPPKILSPYQKTFQLNHTNICANHAIHHIHFTEHILQVHKIGACFFNINKIYYHNLRTIRFNLKSIFDSYDVIQYSNNIYHSELIFHKKNKPILRIKFFVEPYNFNKSHILHIQFCFWNPIFHLLMIIMPLIMYIHIIEDTHYFSNKTYIKDIKESYRFKLYRKYIYSKL